MHTSGRPSQMPGGPTPTASSGGPEEGSLEFTPPGRRGANLPCATARVTVPGPGWRRSSGLHGHRKDLVDAGRSPATSPPARHAARPCAS